MEYIGYIAIPFLIAGYVLFGHEDEKKLFLSKIMFGIALVLIVCDIRIESENIKYWFSAPVYTAIRNSFGTLAFVVWYMVFTSTCRLLYKKISN